MHFGDVQVKHIPGTYPQCHPARLPLAADVGVWSGGVYIGAGGWEPCAQGLAEAASPGRLFSAGCRMVLGSSKSCSPRRGQPAEACRDNPALHKGSRASWSRDTMEAAWDSDGVDVLGAQREDGGSRSWRRCQKTCLLQSP